MSDDFLKDFKYKTTFAGRICKLPKEKSEEYVALASLEKLKSIFPKHINLQTNKDLIGITLNAAIAGVMNDNFDSVEGKTAVSMAPNFIPKFVDWEHRRDRILGCVVNYGFSDINTNQILSSSEASNLNKPFNVSLAIVLYKAALSKQFLAFLESVDEGGPKFGELSGSWELFFKNYDIAVGSKQINEARIISDGPEREELEGLLISNGGSGRYEDKFIYRVIKGENLIPGGIGLVQEPAAEVKGIYIIDPTPSDDEKIDEMELVVSEEDKSKNNNEIDAMKKEELAELIKQSVIQMLTKEKEEGGLLHQPSIASSATTTNSTAQNITIEVSNTPDPTINNNKEKISQIENPTVIATKSKSNFTMIKSINELNEETLKECTASRIQDLFKRGIEEANEKYLAEKTKVEKALNEAKASYEEALQKQKELQANVEAMNTELNEIRASYQVLENEKIARQEVELFNQRMDKINEGFDLSEKQLQIVARHIDGMSNEEFDVYFDEMSELYSGAIRAQASKNDEGDETVETAVASATKVSKELPNSAGAGKQTLTEKYSKAFSKENVLVGR